MKRFEYKVVLSKAGFFGKSTDKMQAEMNAIGAEGWELVYFRLDGKEYEFIYKREKV